MANRRLAELYASGTLILEADLYTGAAEAIFNQALTNGLIAIAIAELPGYGAKAEAGGFLPPARGILRDLESAFGPATDGVITIPDSRCNEREAATKVNVRTLADAVEATDPLRHGRPATRGLRAADIEALVALDQHPALRRLSTAGANLDEVREEAEELLEMGRAFAYLELLDEEEQIRRLDALPVPFAAPGDPPEIEPMDCPACGLPSLLSTGGDGFGYGITTGVCFVCSYRRSSYAAHQVNLNREWDRFKDE